MIELNNLNKGFRKKEVLKNITYKFDKGVYGLLGPNGTGKTTLIRCIVGLFQVKHHMITINGLEINGNKDYINNVGYLPQNFGAFNELSVQEVLEYFGGIKGIEKNQLKSRISECLDLTNLCEQKNTKTKSLSGGMVRRMGIAQSLLNDPDILILDEPTVGLDPEERTRFKKIIKSFYGTKIVLISTHIVSDVEEMCDNIIIMKEGRFVFSGNSALLYDKSIQSMEDGYLCVLAEN